MGRPASVPSHRQPLREDRSSRGRQCYRPFSRARADFGARHRCAGQMPVGVEIGRRTPQCFPALPLEGENSVVPDVRRLRIASRGRGCGHPRRCQNPSHSPPAAIQVESAKLGQVDGPGGESAFGLFESALLPVHIPQGVVLRPDRLPHPFCQIARECSRRRAPLTSPFQTPRADAQFPCDQRETCCCGRAGVRRIF